MYITILLLGFIAFQNRNSLHMVYSITNTLRRMNISQLSNLYDTITTAGRQYLSDYFDRTSYEASENGNDSVLTYYISDKAYKILVKRPPSSSFIVPTLILGTNDKDISDMIAPFMGPHMDFYGIHYTPKDFGQNNIMFEYIKNGRTHTNVFAENDHITL